MAFRERYICTIDTILAEWRAAEARSGDGLTDVDLANLIEALRDEHAAAIAARREEALDLARAPADQFAHAVRC